MLGDSLRRRRGGPRPPDDDGPDTDDREDGAEAGEKGAGSGGARGGRRAGRPAGSAGLGDSLRRSGRRGATGWQGRMERGLDGARSVAAWAVGSGRTWLLAAAVVLVGSFVVGYLLSTTVLFPRPETAGTGITVPSLYGEERSAAESAIRDAGLEVGSVTELENRDTDRGVVVAQEPVPGQQLRRGAAVSFAVSAGAPVLRVPPVRGLSAAAARELLEAVGFEVDESPADEVGGLPGGGVTRTDPPAGTQRELPSRVTLFVVTGPPAPVPDDTVAGDTTRANAARADGTRADAAAGRP